MQTSIYSASTANLKFCKQELCKQTIKAGANIDGAIKVQPKRNYTYITLNAMQTNKQINVGTTQQAQCNATQQAQCNSKQSHTTQHANIVRATTNLQHATRPQQTVRMRIQPQTIGARLTKTQLSHAL